MSESVLDERLSTSLESITHAEAEIGMVITDCVSAVSLLQEGSIVHLRGIIVGVCITLVVVAFEVAQSTKLAFHNRQR